MRQGLSLHQSGRLADAEPFYRRVLDRQPSHPAANHLLGLVRLQQGEPESAVSLIARAVHVRGGDPQYHCNLGVALNAAGRPERAIESFDRAIALQPGYAEAFSNRGMALRAQRRFAEAVESYREALRIRPREPGFFLNLANALNELGDAGEAELNYRLALALRPGYPAALSGLCQALVALGRTDDAIAAGEAAIAASPGQSEFHRILGLALWEAGRPAQALAAWRRALALKPDDAELLRLVSLVQRRASYDDEVRLMVGLAGDDGQGDQARMHLNFALGQAFDDLGEFEKSFQHYLTANALQRRRAPFSLKAAEADVEALMRQFAGVPDRLRQAGTAGAAPVFIVGLPRSGKSTLEGMLGRHPATRKTGELVLMGALVAELRKNEGFGRDSASVAALSESAVAWLGEEYMKRIGRIAPGSRAPIDTMPLNLWHVGFIRLALPGARIVHCVRDPLEHCVAIFQKCFALPGFEFSTDLADLGGYYRMYRRLMRFWDRTFPGAVLEVDLRRLAGEPQAQMRRVLDFCGLTWDPACLAPFETEMRVGDGPREEPAARALRLRPYEPLLAPLLA